LLRVATFENELRDILTQGGAVFESVAGAAADKPYILEIRMTVDQEIAIRGVFVLADAGFDDGRVAQGGEAAG